MRNFLRELHRRNPVLSVTGWIHLAVFAATLMLMQIDGRTILGLNAWVKPMKFALSITIYVWTVGWLLEYVRNAHRWWKMITWGTAISMLAEIVCIVLQSARGTTSHFNMATTADAVIFGIMGVMILLNTLLAAALLILFFRQRTSLSSAYLWGIRLGIIIFLMGSVVGQRMIANFAHTVGAPDGGPGLPILNWSTQFGDMRIAHALGLHALQLLPLLGFVVGRRGGADNIVSGRNRMIIVALAYALAVMGLYVQAVMGKPLFSL
jgi:hypothetical protein